MRRAGTWASVVRAAQGLPAHRVVVAPHAGAGPHALAGLTADLEPDVEIVGVTLPGRESRAGEEFRTLAADPMAAVDAVAAELAGLAPLPTVLFGHSMGAALAAALATVAPELFTRVVVSAPPAARTPRDLAGRWSEDELLALLQRGGATPPEVLASPAWRRHVLELLRVDLMLGVRLTHLCATRRLLVPVTLLGGDADDVAPPLDLPGWRARSERGLQVRLLPGGHFYLLDDANRAAVTAELRTPRALDRVRRSAA